MSSHIFTQIEGEGFEIFPKEAIPWISSPVHAQSRSACAVQGRGRTQATWVTQCLSALLSAEPGKVGLCQGVEWLQRTWKELGLGRWWEETEEDGCSHSHSGFPFLSPVQVKYLLLSVPCCGGCRVAALLAGGLARVTGTLSFLSCVKGISLCQGPSCAPTVMLLYLWAEQAKVICWFCGSLPQVRHCLVQKMFKDLQSVAAFRSTWCWAAERSQRWQLAYVQLSSGSEAENMHW